MGIERDVIPGLFVAEDGAFLEGPHGLFNGGLMVLVGVRAGGSEYDVRADLISQADEGIKNLLPEFRELPHIKTKEDRLVYSQDLCC